MTKRTTWDVDKSGETLIGYTGLAFILLNVIGCIKLTEYLGEDKIWYMVGGLFIEYLVWIFTCYELGKHWDF